MIDDSKLNSTLDRLFNVFVFSILSVAAKAQGYRLGEDLFPVVEEIKAEIGHKPTDWHHIDDLIVEGQIITANYEDFLKEHFNITEFPKLPGK